MNIAKNMEAIFIVVLALAGATDIATAAVPAYRTAHASVALAADAGTMPTVIVTAKRLSPEQKAAL